MSCHIAEAYRTSEKIVKVSFRNEINGKKKVDGVIIDADYFLLTVQEITGKSNEILGDKITIPYSMLESIVSSSESSKPEDNGTVHKTKNN